MAVLLLNASLQPLNVISHRRLVVLLTKERVAFVDEAAERAAAEALAGRRLPEGVVIVRLLRTIHVAPAAPSQPAQPAACATTTPVSTAAASAPPPTSPWTTSSRCPAAVRRTAGRTS